MGEEDKSSTVSLPDSLDAIILYIYPASINDDAAMPSARQYHLIFSLSRYSSMTVGRSFRLGKGAMSAKLDWGGDGVEGGQRSLMKMKREIQVLSERKTG